MLDPNRFDLRLAREDLLPAHTHFDLARWWRCNIKILVVTDASGGFSTDVNFHLGLALEVIENDGWPHVKFEFTRAHRQTPSSGPVDETGFRFDAHDLNQYSQIWLFGISRGNDPLTPSELKALAQFMNEHDGGVFATGDHENLGLPVAGQVPRVRSMRRWYYPSAGPNGEPVAPSQFGSARHDTIVMGTQTDSRPQTITPRMYTRSSNRGFIRFTARFPHPVLCGPTGPINYLPDHMHEGLCEVPDDLTDDFDFDGYTGDDYPVVGGTRVAPEVIAWAQSHGTTATGFGVLSAYDGHRANVGRVLCDATWHHWFNINLRGYKNNAENPGDPSYDSGDAYAWQEIQAYFRNVGVWLATPHIQRCLRNGGWLAVTRYADFLMTFRRLDNVRDHLGYYFGIGTVAKDALGRLASQCQTTRVTVEALREVELLPDPWKGLGPDDPYRIDREVLELVALGGAVHHVAEKFAESDFEKVMANSMEKVEGVANEGALRAARSYLESLKETGEQAGKLVQALGRG